MSLSLIKIFLEFHLPIYLSSKIQDQIREKKRMIPSFDGTEQHKIKRRKPRHIRNTAYQLLLRKTHHPSGGPPSVLVSGRCLLHSTISLNCFLPYSLLFALL
uniref:Uncharacterized protein n=1 Tax=Opuntia streptacantha TaxID=393608 RepID=A0A7C9DBL4_OPUST